MEFLDKVMMFLVSTEGQVAIIAVVAEFVMRALKTEKPVGIIHAASKFAKIGASFANKVAEILSKFAEVSDKIFPQRLK